MTCSKKKPCGCGDQPISSPSPCNQSGPCAGEPCSEMFCEECIVHCQPDIFVELEGDIAVTITQGMRWDEIIQTLLIAYVDPACVGQSAIGLKLLSKTSDTITIKWVSVAGVNYTVTWQEGNNIYTATVHDVSQYTMINLLPETLYSVKLVTESGPCESVTMQIITNAIV